MKLGIVIPTYQRKDGTTPNFLIRALESIKKQTYQNFKVYLIGDCYESNDEFEYLATSIIPKEKIFFENLPIAVERDRYPDGGAPLWRCGGINAANYGNKKCYNDGINYICQLDHDDYWDAMHLEIIAHTIKLTNDSSFLFTCSQHFNNQYLPNVVLDNNIIEQVPIPAGMIRSSACINYDALPLLYRDTFFETGVPDAADADLWKRIKYKCENDKLKSYLIRSLTCYHLEENH